MTAIRYLKGDATSPGPRAWRWSPTSATTSAGARGSWWRSPSGGRSRRRPTGSGTANARPTTSAWARCSSCRWSRTSGWRTWSPSAASGRAGTTARRSATRPSTRACWRRRPRRRSWTPPSTCPGSAAAWPEARGPVSNPSSPPAW